MVVHHGREPRGSRIRRRAAVCCNGLLGGPRGFQSAELMMVTGMDEFIELLVTGIKGHVEELAPKDSDGGIAGYALIVDTDMVAVMGASASRRFIDKQNDESLIFSPLDWPSESHSESFGRASERMANLPNLANTVQYNVRVREVVIAMSTALQRARREEAALGNAMLLVVCADGGGVWDGEEGEAVRQLNGVAAYENWLRSAGRS